MDTATVFLFKALPLILQSFYLSSVYVGNYINIGQNDTREQEGTSGMVLGLQVSA